MAELDTSLRLSAPELRGMTKWSEPVVEEFLSIIRTITQLSADVEALNSSLIAFMDSFTTENVPRLVGTATITATNTSVVVSDPIILADSQVLVTVASADATLTSAYVVASVGSFEIFGNAAADADTDINYAVFNL